MSDPRRLRSLGLDLQVVWGSDSTARPPIGDEPRAATLMEMATVVSVREDAGCHVLDLGEFGSFRHNHQRSEVTILRMPTNPTHLDPVLHGPVLLHALAHLGCYVIHASAIRRPGEAVTAVIADSGVGKSTLAQMASDLGWERVADDLLPLRCEQQQIFALPKLHQPKLTAACQYPSTAPDALALGRIVCLRRSRQGAAARLGAGACARVILENTVAMRVYPKQALAEHLRFTATLAQQVERGRIEALDLQVEERPDDIAGAIADALDRIAA